MKKSESGDNMENVCNLSHLTELTGGNKHSIKKIIDAFLKQVPEELQRINDAVIRLDFVSLKIYVHTMKSTICIMGISVLVPVLKGMKDLGSTAEDIEKIIELKNKLNLICTQAIAELEMEKHNYV